ncbi:MAG: hypothetical protein FWG42_09215 [Clostridiales bacterium]|nr:hypothetical protein [Clostridiales bacterium]
MKKNELSFISVAFMYVGTIMGAGFASGREIWQFFGVFGKMGYVGVVFVAACFMLVGFMTSRIARALGTSEMGAVTVPAGNRFLKGFVAHFMAIILFLAYVTLDAAGGAIGSQQFGQSPMLGGAVVTSLVILTVIGGVDRGSGGSRYIVPFLMATVIFTGASVVAKHGGLAFPEATFEASPLAGNWLLAAAMYLSYNMLPVIPIVSVASIRARSSGHAYAGSVLGGLFMGAMAFMLFAAMMTDMSFSASMDMPMLAFSGRLSTAANAVYLGVLFFAIYASATINFYGFTIKYVKEPKRTVKIIAAALVGFLVSLVGFTQIIAYVFPVIGLLGISIMLMLGVNFVRTGRKEKMR